MTAALSSKMASGKDTASFFTKGSNAQFRYVLSLYPQTLKLKAELKNKKPEELIKLDNWYQNELPKKIKARGKDAHLNHEELVQLMKWKQSRGKAYPQLNYLVKVNTPRAVMAETKKGFKKLPNLEQAITALSNLKGVGTTMASALLAAANPEAAPFMADECLMAIPEIEGIDYTIKEYLNFVNHIQATAERLNKECPNNIEKWNAHQVELALWTHFVASELSPQLLDSIPETNGKAAHQNGECQNDESAENSRGAEETETGDGEDSRAAADDDSRATPEDQDSAQSDTTHDSERVVAADEDSVDAGATDEDSRAEPPSKKPRAGE